MMASTATTDATLMARLKDATSEHHRRAEGRRLQKKLVKGDLARPCYGAYLGQLLRVHSRLEKHLSRLAAEHATLAAVYQEQHARKADLLADLEFYGADPGPETEATLHFLADLDRWADEAPEALLGALYVLEGSMNGNRFIAQVLTKKWSLAPGPGLRYLDPYGDDQPRTWAAFRAAVNQQEFSPSEALAIISAARATFDAIGAISDEVYAAGAA